MDVQIGDQTLTGPIPEEGVSGYQASVKRTAQTLGGIGANSAETADRGNEQTSVAFSIAREHADAKQAGAFVNRHIRTVRRHGTLILREDGETTYVPGATLTAITGDNNGATTVHHYTFTGGAMTDQAPTGSGAGSVPQLY